MKSIFIYHLNNLKWFTPLAFVFTGIFTSIPAQAIQFNFTYTENTSPEVVNGFLAAGDIWSSKFNDTFVNSNCSCEQNTAINIHIDFNQINNAKALGTARTNMLSVDYQKFLNSSFQDITSADDLTAFKSLQIPQYDKKNFLKSLGVDLKRNTYTENFNILQQQGFNINTNLNYIEPNSNDIIAAQAEDIFQQLNIEQLENVNRNQVEFSGSTFNMLIDDESTSNLNDNQLAQQTTIDEYNKELWLSRSNAKVLGLLDGDNNEIFDAQIVLNNSMFAANGNIISHDDWLAQNPEGNFLEDTIWDFSRVNDPNAEVANNKFDFLSVALHEIGHALGFTSGVDAVNFLKIKAEENNETLSKEYSELVTSMDLFRFSDQSKQHNVFDWSSNEDIFFSIDNGETKLAEFADGISYQTSHWSENGDVNGNSLGIMHPVLAPEEKLDLTVLDLRLLDILGYDKVEYQVSNLLEDSGEEQNTKLVQSEFDISYNYGGSSSGGFSFWQEVYESQDEYNMLFKEESQNVTTPEPNIILGLGIVGLFGWFHRRNRRI
ncbi:MAG: NF038122 family metalloprotease [Mastigocoleus sp. MO_167.B18]|nr:NF038122 family metalloprotease [Mastigocoleus sp. MO_167.B18]